MPEVPGRREASPGTSGICQAPKPGRHRRGIGPPPGPRALPGPPPGHAEPRLTKHTKRHTLAMKGYRPESRNTSADPTGIPTDDTQGRRSTCAATAVQQTAPAKSFNTTHPPGNAPGHPSAEQRTQGPPRSPPAPTHRYNTTLHRSGHDNNARVTPSVTAGSPRTPHCGPIKPHTIRERPAQPTRPHPAHDESRHRRAPTPPVLGSDGTHAVPPRSDSPTNRSNRRMNPSPLPGLRAATDRAQALRPLPFRVTPPPGKVRPPDRSTTTRPPLAVPDGLPPSRRQPTRGGATARPLRACVHRRRAPRLAAPGPEYRVPVSQPSPPSGDDG